MAIVATHVAAVQELYVAYFGRPADPAGLDYWTNIVEAQGTTAAVSATFAESDEYQDAFEGMTNTQIVNQIYKNMFGREAEATGRDYWVKLLDAGTISVDFIVADIAKAAVGTDGEAVENKVAAATAFTNALDLPAEVAGYAGDAALTLAKAFITGVTTDATLEAATTTAALNATVAAVVAAGTEFTLEGAMANLLAAQEAKSDVLADLAENEAVAAELAKLPSSTVVTDTHIQNAIKAVQTAAATAANKAELLGSTFSGASAAMQAALIADREAELADQLKADNTALTTANTAANKVDNLTAAVTAYTEAAAEATAATQAATLAGTAQTAAIANLGTLTGRTVDTTTDPAKVTLTATGTAAARDVIVWDSTDAVWKVAPGATEANTQGLTAALTAMNAYNSAFKAKTEADKASAEALLAADILDVSDDGTLLANVAAAFSTTLGEDELPTLEMIRTEEALFEARMDTLDSNAAAAGQTNYAGAIAKLKLDVAAAATPTAAKAVVTAAGTAGNLTAADVTAINKAIDTPPATGTVNDVIDANNWAARDTAFANAVSALIAGETAGPGADTGIGNLAQAVIDAQDAIDATEELIADLAEAVANYEAAQALGADVTAADNAIKAASKVITDEGFAAPIALKTTTLNLSTAKDDIFLVSGTADAEIRSFGVQGEDTLYVGTALTYNDTEIGSGTGQTKLTAAGDDSVLEFFLEQRGNDVFVLIENKAFASSSTNAVDVTEIRLVGVDLEDITIANGFITV